MLSIILSNDGLFDFTIILTFQAVGLNCDIVHFGSPIRGENVERLIRLIEIEDALGKDKVR